MASARELDSRKQARCRETNELEAAMLAPAPGHSACVIRCECGDPHCATTIALSLADYECVRTYPTRFAIAPNHENPESEHVLQQREKFAVVEVVTAEEMKLARRGDPRQARRESRTAETAPFGKRARRRRPPASGP